MTPADCHTEEWVRLPPDLQLLERRQTSNGTEHAEAAAAVARPTFRTNSFPVGSSHAMVNDGVKFPAESIAGQKPKSVPGFVDVDKPHGTDSYPSRVAADVVAVSANLGFASFVHDNRGTLQAQIAEEKAKEKGKGKLIEVNDLLQNEVEVGGMNAKIAQACNPSSSKTGMVQVQGAIPQMGADRKIPALKDGVLWQGPTSHSKVESRESGSTADLDAAERGAFLNDPKQSHAEQCFQEQPQHGSMDLDEVTKTLHKNVEPIYHEPMGEADNPFTSVLFVIAVVAMGWFVLTRKV